jgi:hypothetical protein
MGSASEIGVDDGGEHFGDEADCDADAEERGVLPVSGDLAGDAENLNDGQ